jgi:hypothetical protein
MCAFIYTLKKKIFASKIGDSEYQFLLKRKKSVSYKSKRILIYLTFYVLWNYFKGTVQWTWNNSTFLCNIWLLTHHNFWCNTDFLVINSMVWRIEFMQNTKQILSDNKETTPYRRNHTPKLSNHNKVFICISVLFWWGFFFYGHKIY